MSDGEWGKMVLPGVYMIQRGSLLTHQLEGNKENYLPHPDLIHHDIKELESLVSKLKNSSKEIEDYLSDLHREKTEGQKMVTVNDDMCDEDEEFREALMENKRIIEEKEGELQRLHNLIDFQACGKSLHEKNSRNFCGGEQNLPDPEEIESPIRIDL